MASNFVALNRRTMLIVSLCVTTAFLLRVALAYGQVFGGERVSFIETDAWYHMRLVDGLIRHFPHRIWFDPYLHHPGGEAVNVGPFFDWLVAGLALLLGAGSPSARFVDQVGAFVPPVLGALTVIPVYVIGRELFSRQAGFWAGAIVGILPGELLVRSLLGFTDHHCAEVLLSSLTIMCLVLALRPGLTPSRRVIHAVSGGTYLGAYLLTWSGGALFVAILLVWALIQVAVDALRRPIGHEVLYAGVPVFAVGGLMLLPFSSVLPYARNALIGIFAGVLAILLPLGIATTTGRLRHGRAAFLGALVLLPTVAGLGAAWLAPEVAASIWVQIQRFSLTRSSVLAVEALPLMRSRERLPFPLWNQFTTCLILFVVGGALAARESGNRWRAPRVLMAVWTAAMLLATIGQVRFSYYLAVNVALLAGHACAALVTRIVARQSAEIPRGRRRVTALAGGLLLACAIMLPNIDRYRTLSGDVAGLATWWDDALQWLALNTPDPFDPPRQYAWPAGAGTLEPAVGGIASYGVLSTWDKGYNIIRLAQRVPIANPKQTGARESATFFLGEDEASAATLAATLGARYILVDQSLQARILDKGIATGVLGNLAASIDQDRERYVRVAFRQTPDGRQPVLLYEPAYYRTMMSRMLRYGGRSSTDTWVVTVVERNDDGSRFWELVNQRKFDDLGAAETFVRSADSVNVRIVGLDPMISCVPVEPLQRFSRVYRALETETRDGPPAVQIFTPTASAP